MLQWINISNGIISKQTKRKKLKSIIKLTAKVSMLFTWWNAYYVINNTSEKAETVFNIRLNNYREETKNPNAIIACRRFKRQGHNFNSQIKFTITDKLVNTSSSKDILCEDLIQHKNFLIKKLKTPYGLNTKLSK